MGRVLSTRQGKAEVEYFDGRRGGGVDLSVVPAEKGAFIEVFGNVALGTLSRAEAKKRREMWSEIRKAMAKDMEAGH